MRGIIPLLFLALIVTGCERPTPVQVDAPDLSAEVTALPSVKGAPPAATGSGHFIDNRPNIAEPGQLRTFSFSAVEGGNGVHGQWQLNSRGFPAVLHGTVECLATVGNQAWFAGTTTRSDVPGFVGVVWGFYVVDNGEGGKSPPDQISVSNELVGGAETWCADQPVVALFDVERGNVQVR